MQTLKHIVVDIEVDAGDSDDLLFGIPSELEFMCTKNIIETVTIKIMVRLSTSDHPGSGWGRLDKVLTSPGWFSLKRVSLVIEIDTYSRSSKLEVAFRNLSDTQFLRLSSSNSILFDFKVIPIMIY
jgi:hypothetical protein